MSQTKQGEGGLNADLPDISAAGGVINGGGIAGRLARWSSAIAVAASTVTDDGAGNLGAIVSASFGASPALAGRLRLPPDGQLNFRNAALANDVTGILLDGGDNLRLGGTIGGLRPGLLICDVGSTYNFSVGGTERFGLNAGTVTVSINQLRFAAGGLVTAPVFGQLPNTAAGAPVTAQTTEITAQGATGAAGGGNPKTGGELLVHGGDITGTASTNTGGLFVSRGGNAAGGTANVGGAWFASPGSGATAGGALTLANGAGTARFRITDAGIAFFNGAPRAQPTVTGALSLVTDANAGAVLLSIIQALDVATGLSLLIDGTT